MEGYKKLYTTFIDIVGEGSCTPDEVKKYLSWGNYNLETSLNYYFQQQSKVDTPDIIQFPSSQVQKSQSKQKKVSGISSSISSQLIDDSSSRNSENKQLNAYDLLNEGSQKMKAIDKIIDNLQNGQNQKKKQASIKIDKAESFELNDNVYQKHQTSYEQQEQLYEQFKSQKEAVSIQQSHIKDSDEEEEENGMEMEKYSFQQQQKPLNILRDCNKAKENEEQQKEKYLPQLQPIQKTNQESQKLSIYEKDNANDKLLPLSSKDLEFSAKKIEMGEGQNIQFPCLLGSFEVQGHSRTSQQNQMIQGDEIILKIEKCVSKANLQKNKKQKSSNQTLQQVIQIKWNDRQVGRVNSEFEEILYPLIDRGYIFVKSKYVYAPPFLNPFTNIHLQVEVYLINNCFTKPITTVIEENSVSRESQILRICSETKESFCKLFDRINLTKIVGTLINISDNKKNNNKPVNSVLEIESNSIDSSTISNTQQPATQKIDINNPFAKIPKQKSIMEFKIKPITQTASDNQLEDKQNQKEQAFELQPLSLTESNAFDFEKVFEEAEGYAEFKLSEPPSTFKTNLHPYQKQALTWMLTREGKQTDMNYLLNKNMRTLHPLWEQYRLPNQKLQQYIYFNPYSGQLSLIYPRASSECRGGILADEMGLGKTVMMLSLIHSNKRASNKSNVENSVSKQSSSEESDEANDLIEKEQTKPKLKNTSIISKMHTQAGTLVILPVTLLHQWQEEIQTHSESHSISWIAHYGSDRKYIDLTQFDIVFTTYGTISSEFASNLDINKSLYKYDWHRIVLDEAHYIKGRTIQIAKAVYQLKGNNRWCMTGTPLQNKLDELFPLLHFIKLEPWSDYLWWNTHINKPHERGEKKVFNILQTILKPVLLRRTKKSKDSNGNPIIMLPPKYTKIQYIELSQQEREFYDSIYIKSKQEFDGLLAQGVLLSNYMKVFELLLRLRQICDHIFMMTTRGDVQHKDGIDKKLRSFIAKRNKQLQDKLDQQYQKIIISNISSTADNLAILNKNIDNNNNNKKSYFEPIFNENNEEVRVEIPCDQQFELNDVYLNKVVENIVDNNNKICNICFEDMEDAVITACLHITCRLCAIRSIDSTAMCPICRKTLCNDDIMTIPRDQRFSFDVSSQFVRSSKMESIMNYITTNIQNTQDKCLLFTQFLGVMELFELDFKKSNIPYLRLDGSLTQKQRAEAINKFNEDNSIKVFMISLKAGGVGLNLVKANHVLMVDPWWNPAVEEQAIERCHRIGQKKEVNVVRFICSNTIEQRMIFLHEEKRNLFENTIQTSKGEEKEQNIKKLKFLMEEN